MSTTSSTTSTTSPTVNLTGIVSNTDWQSLVSEITADQKTAAEQPLNNDLTTEQNLLSAWQSFNTTLSALTNYINTNNLNTDTGYQAFTGSLSCSDSSITPSNVLSASTGSGTIAAGTYSIVVTKLAEAEKIASGAFSSSSTALGFSGNLLINGTTVSIASTDTLSDIVSKINSSGAGVNASLLTASGETYMTIQSGQGSSSITVADGTSSTVAESLGLLSNGQIANQIQSGQNAELTVDGYSVTSASNTVSGVIPGVTLSLTGTNSSSDPITLTISQDTSTLTTDVNTLVSDINSVLSYINTQNTYNSSSSSSSSTSNVLMGNPTLAAIKSSIDDTLLGNISGNSTYTTADSIGIEFGVNGSTDGTISLDSNTFSAALSANPTEVINAIKSISASLYTNLNGYVDPTTGTLTSLQTSISDKITSINEQLTQVDERCAQQAQALQNEYNNLEVAIENSNNTKTFLTDMVNTMTDSNSNTSSSSSSSL
jgi:flagellar hook-associated protein 2